MMSEIGSPLVHAVARRVCGLLLVAVLAAGCASSTPPKAGESLPTSDVDPSTIPGLAHVHGLGVNGDGDLYAATHFGLWRIPTGGEARRVDDYAHDFMGFAIVGEDHFLASGHPNGARDLPPHLGLIESTDAGRTWKSVSRMGKSDFHVLRSSGRRTYGWSTTSGRLEVTSDRERWSDRGELNLLDLSVDPMDDRNLLAAVAASDTEVVMRESVDGGRSWKDLDAAPMLVRLDWSTKGQAWGVDSDGVVYIRDGDDWSRQGRLASAAEAITSHRDSWYAAATGAIHKSDDGGKTWGVVVEYDV